MSSASDFAAGVRAYIAAVASVADDPADRVRMLAELARYRPTEGAGAGAVGTAMAAMRDAVAALCRRAALVELGRAVAASSPPSYDHAIALRDLVCDLLDEEILAVGGIDDASAAAMRALKVAVAADLNARAANLATLIDITAQAPLPALVQAYRQYQDIGRADQLCAYADAADPNFLPPAFRALSR